MPPSARTPLVQAEKVSHWYGEDELRRQILFDVTFDLNPGEVVILTGPSGSGKTTFLTLVGALRSMQAGRLTVLGRDLRDAPSATLVELRRRVGYIFQHHNLVDSLQAWQNVELAVSFGGVTPQESRKLALETLEAVGLGEHAHKYPSQLSGGQRQRVAVARALAARPSIVLADEPTASLDRQSGKEVVELLKAIVRRRGGGALIVTHDNRILEVADRIVNLEDGRLTSYTAACTAESERMFTAMSRTLVSGRVAEQVRDMDVSGFAGVLEDLTREVNRFLSVLQVTRHAAFERMLEQILEAFTLKIGALLGADRATLFIVDRAKGEIWSKVAEEEREIRFPLGAGVAGHVAATGRAMNVPDAYEEPRFNRAIDVETGYRTRNLLCLPILDTGGQVFAVMQLLNKAGDGPFVRQDEERFRSFIGRLSVILETWTALRPAEAGRAQGG
jgi:putative ABC transport system ATP-binding protein